MTSILEVELEIAPPCGGLAVVVPVASGAQAADGPSVVPLGDAFAVAIANGSLVPAADRMALVAFAEVLVHKAYGLVVVRPGSGWRSASRLVGIGASALGCTARVSEEPAARGSSAGAAAEREAPTGGAPIAAGLTR